METAFIVFRQTVVMFLYMSAGYCLFKTEKLTYRGSKDIATLLVWLVIPAVLVNSFCAERSLSRIIELLESAFVTALSLIIAMAVARLIFRDRPIDNFGAAFSNAGFIGIPLVQAALGDDAVFWIASMVAMMNMLQWSYGVGLLTGEKSAVGLRHLIYNPILVGITIGLILFFTGLGTHLPTVVSEALAGVSSLNAPLAMIVLGSYLAQSDMKKMLTSVHLYWASTVRLIIIPAITLIAFGLIGADHSTMLAVFIALSTPMGANVAVYAQLYDGDYPYACQAVAITTLISIITLPLMIMLSSLVI